MFMILRDFIEKNIQKKFYLFFFIILQLITVFEIIILMDFSDKKIYNSNFFFFFWSINFFLIYRFVVCF